MIFVKSVLGGVVAVVLTWVIIIFWFMWRLEAVRRQQGETGLGAVAGGWNYLLHLPSVVILLTAAFGVGLYITARWQ